MGSSSRTRTNSNFQTSDESSFHLRTRTEPNRTELSSFSKDFTDFCLFEPQNSADFFHKKNSKEKLEERQIFLKKNLQKIGTFRLANLVSNFELLRTSKTRCINSSFRTRTKFCPIPKRKALPISLKIKDLSSVLLCKEGRIDPGRKEGILQQEGSEVRGIEEGQGNKDEKNAKSHSKPACNFALNKL